MLFKMTKFDQGVPMPVRSAEIGGQKLKLDVEQQAMLMDLKKYAMGGDSIKLIVPADADPLRYMNRVTGYCHSVGGPGWATARYLGNHEIRIWKKMKDLQDMDDGH